MIRLIGFEVLDIHLWYSSLCRQPSAPWELGQVVSMGLGPGVGEGCLVSSVQCPVSSVQGPGRGAEPGIWRERQEEETRRGSPIDNRPSTSTGWFFLQPLGQEKVAVMCCKGTCRRWQWCVEKIPAGGDSDVLKIYLVEVTVMCCKDTCRRWQWYAVNLPGGGDSDVM